MIKRPKIKRLVMAIFITSTASMSIAPLASANTFSDVKSADDHFEAISHLSNRGWINGYKDGKFGVWDNIKRQQATIIMTKALKLKYPDNAESIISEYKDLSTKDPAYKDIAAAIDAGILKGSKSKFNPWKDITREQVATVLVRTFKLDEYEPTVNAHISLKNVSPDHRKNVKILADLEITNALKDFKPSKPITRGAFATMIYNADLAVRNATTKPQNKPDDNQKPVVPSKPKPDVPVKPKPEVPPVKPTNPVDDFEFDVDDSYDTGDYDDYEDGYEEGTPPTDTGSGSGSGTKPTPPVDDKNKEIIAEVRQAIDAMPKIAAESRQLRDTAHGFQKAEIVRLVAFDKLGERSSQAAMSTGFGKVEDIYYNNRRNWTTESLSSYNYERSLLDQKANSLLNYAKEMENWYHNHRSAYQSEISQAQALGQQAQALQDNYLAKFNAARTKVLEAEKKGVNVESFKREVEASYKEYLAAIENRSALQQGNIAFAKNSEREVTQRFNERKIKDKNDARLQIAHLIGEAGVVTAINSLPIKVDSSGQETFVTQDNSFETLFSQYND